ncbi:TIGR02569 family protein [Catellatospora sp. NPDC049133]|uniref:TIGR02569 family protein n=1 Tax=Catellatospora sp. NPDC049133 TaxID=3155499 RepID=UPI0033D04F21
MARDVPDSEILAAFGGRGPALRMPGGQGRTWRAGDVVVKPGGLEAETTWVAEVLSSLPESRRFRVAQPVRAADGGWTVLGWQAWRLTPGSPDPRRWDDVLSAGDAFHEALAGLARPSFLDDRDDPWSFGDRVAWQELPLRGGEVMTEVLEPLARARRPVHSPSQVVHGDLLGNVMFADGLAPAVIDWPVYHRPASWALAVAVVDAMTWHDASEALPDRWADRAEWDQMLVRALMYRIATNEGRRRVGLPVTERVEQYRSVVDLVLARLE